MKTKKILVMLLLCAATFVGCKTNEKVEEVAKVKEYTINDNVIEVKKGEKFEIQLEENLTTGYSWMRESSDGSVVREVMKEENVTEEPGEEQLVGAPTEGTYTFEARNEGETEIKFSYKRPWESIPAEKEKVFKVKVMPGYEQLSRSSKIENEVFVHTIKNVTDEDVHIQYMSGEKIQFIVYNDGKLIHDSSREMAFTQALIDEVITAGDEIVFDLNLSQFNVENIEDLTYQVYWKGRIVEMKK